MKNNAQNGFTLIELVVVMAIMAVLVSLASFNFQQARMRARDVARKNDLKQLQNAMELYKGDQSSAQYPSSLNDLVPNYIKELPVDPKYKVNINSWSNYSYTANVSGDSLKYWLETCLENSGDASRYVPVTTCPSGVNTGVLYRLTEP